MENKLSLYIHIPFCKKRCYYCDFNTFAGRDSQIGQYFKALSQEIHQVGTSEKNNALVHSIYFGGGTPSYVQPEYILGLMQTIRTLFDVGEDCEITIEANPGTITRKKLETYLVAGINRISMGVQSVMDEELQRLGRIHTFADVEQNVALARSVGIRNISVDLIFGLPGQTLADWKNTLEKIITLNIEHLSLYSLMIEEDTPFGNWVQQGAMAVPDDDLMADQYTAAQNWLAEHAFVQYEISNWARNEKGHDFRSLHNCQYWRNLPYIGFGLGAHSCINHQRLANTAQMEKYISSCLSQPTAHHSVFPACEEGIEIDRQTEMQESMMLGLRMVKEGISRKMFLQRYGVEMELIFRKEIEELIIKGLVEWQDDNLVLSSRGILLGNQAFVKFV